ncbi:uncharacterized protein C8Q71DRAFT_862024 [Rhodofomes roseus]|uniref:Uncharacterized protein n=1 Tax=Rhodofomes roseus TaxID=34475 RepID=A0ABQ8K2E2_9APHY|nr:uncharacterized protein C8Q71DRAFT_862024 [Rhodofomes roseus]KAH9830882.1 hypothetical protein C8Q71DRAFT_862024 [Rhodofomes roseus]
MAPPSRSTTHLPRFRSSLWFPMDYQVLPQRLQVRDANWPLYTGHRAVRVMAALGDGTYAVSPNADYVPSPPPGPQDREEILSNGRRGVFEPGYHPQEWRRARGHWPFIHGVPPGAEGIDPAYVLLDCKRGSLQGTFRLFSSQSGKGKSDPAFIQALTSLYDAELQQAEGFLSQDPDPPSSFILRPDDVKEARYQFEYIDSNLETARGNVAIIQRHLLELRAYSYRSYLLQTFNEGRLATPSPHLTGIGCWVRSSDEDLMKRLVWCGIPVWYIRRDGPPSNQLLLRVSSLDKRLSTELWDDEEHGPPREKNKKSSRREKQLEADFLSAEEDSDFDWEKSHGLRRPPPVAGPSLPTTRPPAPQTTVDPFAALSNIAEEEGWVNQSYVNHAQLSSPPRSSPDRNRRMIVTPPPRVDSPMIIGSPPPRERIESPTRPPQRISSTVPNQPDKGKRRASPPPSQPVPLPPLPRRRSPPRLPASTRRPRSPRRHRSPPGRHPSPPPIPRRERTPVPSERSSRRRSRSPSPRRGRPRERRSEQSRSPRRLHLSPVRYTPRWMNRPPSSQRIDFDERRRANRREEVIRPPARTRERSPVPSRRSRSPASPNEPRASFRPPSPPPAASSLPLEQRLAPPTSEPPRRPLLERLEAASLLSRLGPSSSTAPVEGDSSEVVARAGASLFERLGLPLENRITDVSPLTPPAPPVVLPPADLHTVSLPSGVPLRTRLPLYSAAAVDEYIHHPFERDGGGHTLRLEGEDELGPAPTFTQDAKTPVPSPQLLLAEGDEGYLATITWLQNRGPCLLRLERKPENWLLRNNRQWRSNLRGPPDLVRAARNDSTRPLPDDAVSPLRNPLPNERENEIWRLRTFLFRYNFERLAARLLPSLQAATTDAARGAVWAGVRDRIRRVWGAGATLYPAVDEPRYFDSDDDAVRMRHWFAIRRLMLEWNLREDIAQDLRLAMGGTVMDAVERIKAAYANVYRNTYENRDPQVFVPRP